MDSNSVWKCKALRIFLQCQGRSSHSAYQGVADRLLPMDGAEQLDGGQWFEDWESGGLGGFDSKLGFMLEDKRYALDW